MSELIFKSLDFDVQTIFCNLASIFQRIVVYKLLVSSNNKIKVKDYFDFSPLHAALWLEKYIV